MTTLTTADDRRATARQLVGALIVAVLSSASWLLWMGWDTVYQVDPVNGVRSGPYETWQVVGCGLSLLVVFVAALLLSVRPRYASVALVVAFTAAFTWSASRLDDSGMFVLGGLLMAAGLSLATTVGSWVALVISHRRR